MADRPALFSGPMVRSMMEGTKTQTRRANHLERLRRFGPITEFGRSDTPGYDWHFRDKGMRWHDLRHGELLKYLPWETGDRLWVRENWCPLEALGAWDVNVLYLADNQERLVQDGEFGDRDWTWPKSAAKGCVPSMHMPRWASRLTLNVTDVRVERLQDISEPDAIAEGAYVAPKSGRVADSYVSMSVAGEWFVTGRAWYRNLWERINGPGSWTANPWVAAYTFTVQHGNIDQLARAA